MGKILVIKGSNFSANAVKKVEIVDGQTFYSPFDTNDLTLVVQKIGVEGSQYMLDAGAGDPGAKCIGFMLPIVFRGQTTVVVNTTDAYSGKTVGGITDVVGALYYTTMDLTNADITKIPMSTSLVDLEHLSDIYIKANTSNEIQIPSDAKGGVLYFWVNDDIFPVTPEIFNAIISTILVQ